MEKVTFLVTNKCNFKCRHCFVNAGREISNELTEEEKYKAIDNLYNLGIKKVTFSGGEPLIDKEIFAYMNYAKNKGLKIGFLTNGLLLDEKKLLLLRKIVDTFSISLYTQDILGINQEIYNQYLNKIIEKLKKLTEMNFEFKVTIPISTSNKEKAIELITLIYNEKIKPKMVRIYTITPLGRGKQNKSLCTEESNCSEIITNLPEETRNADFDINLEYASINKTEKEDARFFKYCTILNYSSTNYITKYGDPHMDANGDLYLCGLVLRNKEYCIGNIIHNSKDEIIKKIDKVVELIKQNKKVDCCPALNRNANVNQKLVCPVIHLKSEFKKEGV